jgi:hypothetical protein
MGRTRFAQLSTVRTYLDTIDYSNAVVNVAGLSLEAPLNYRTSPPWEFVLSASRNSLQSYELSRLSHAANLRKEITQLLDSWLEENSAAMLARWLMEQRETPAVREHGAPEGAEHSIASAVDERMPSHARGKAVHAASDNFFADQTPATREFRARS